LETAFQVYVGVILGIVPEGEINVAARGAVGIGVVNGRGPLQGPKPAGL
jgi:hypothetical protein